MGILTYIYLIRHSEQLKIKGKKINNEEEQPVMKKYFYQ